ncbi:MAG: Cell shape determining protein, MreB/Mrl family [Candidatus Roizmanbacteria bacterium GW2011_GWC2_41_7]|uniref:Cell shape-determining protein MreB n=3 Tax=Patescibacteria group TaxID=1783273 RepID=A0A0G0X5P2_9BACT|nr:MAG: Cell shape determining protein, MreB/Mrl family [Candidatus Roizmanbacteria bacterium GW2011_GWC2_41_7]OGZ20196.1 MAG: rod shape-determining protein [Candidatus Nealsonbacteria bacterium RIFCSPHIGHO2_01_FULL_43_31]OGZ21836.1 MAG: rod shape-determining protein [Candidatus Nealsonbacteria bacterium RIFCSPHIGHO2_02_FULL_43_13]OGZ25015.1 MAG: rod shape-determining protein [Candidatus Nealsonbacteria bacterium RIFCSPLOWO2_01_FULL_43_36]
MFVRKIGIDLGTCNSLVFVPKKGVVLQEPSVVAVSLQDNKILAIGEAAKEMIGKTPDTIRVYRPMKDGVIADFRVTQAMLGHFIEKTVGPFKLFKPELLISVPAGITSTEKRAVLEAAINAGAKEAYVVKEPILAALGAGIPINACSGNLIVDIGGGTSEVAVISLGGIVTSSSVRVAGDKMDKAIGEYIKDKHNVTLGEQTTEEIKIKIGTAIPEKEEKTLSVRGRDMVSGLPKTIKVSSNEVCEAISEILTEIIHTIKHVLRDTPPELSSDVMDKGMVISGGGALLNNIDKLIAKETGVPCFVAEEPLLCVVKGTGVVLENLDVYKKSIMSKR